MGPGYVLDNHGCPRSIHARLHQPPSRSVGGVLLLFTGKPLVRCRLLTEGELQHSFSYPPPESGGHFLVTCRGHLALGPPPSTAKGRTD